MSKVTLKPVISKLREIIIKDIAGKMEKYGFDDAGRIVINKPLSEYDNVIKNNLIKKSIALQKWLVKTIDKSYDKFWI